MKKINIKAWNKKTGNAYVYCEKTEHADFYEVATKLGQSPWIIRSEDISFSKPKEIKSITKKTPNMSEKMIGNKNASKNY